MESFEAKSLCILGRQPALGLAELESLYGAEHIRPLDGAALLDIEAGEINFKRLGGSVKVARPLAEIPSSEWADIRKYLLQTVPGHLKNVPEGKFTLGLSVYGLPVAASQVNQTTLAIKKVAGRSMRVVPNKTPALNSAQVLHNKLTTRGAWELIVVRYNSKAILAQTFFVQDIEAYGARDQARPARDARVGMLPPKLAQIMINLAHPPDSGTVLDPFCGTGVMLQEALLMGYGALGSDIEPRMVEYSARNIEWLKKQHTGLGKFQIEQADATSHQWKEPFDVVVSETYLGRPLSSLPAPHKLEEIVNDVNTITKKFLKNLLTQLRTSAPAVCLAVPAWRGGASNFKHLPVIDHLTDMGYNIRKFKHVGGKDLIYYRENQIVARQLIILEVRR